MMDPSTHTAVRKVNTEYKGVLIDRRTKWGNPFPSSRSLDRYDSVEMYYKNLTYAHIAEMKSELTGKILLCHCYPLLCHGDIIAHHCGYNNGPFRVAQLGEDAYEVSSKGDARFSAFYARLPDGRSIEEVYQCDIKGYKTIRSGKGQPPLRKISPVVQEYAYLSLWRQWSEFKQNRIWELAQHATDHKYRLSDMFARKGGVNQAHALVMILNDWFWMGRLEIEIYLPEEGIHL